MTTSRKISVLRAALASGLMLLAPGSCGRAADDEPLQIDSNTNWQKRCESDDECSGSLRCYCGQCSQPCASNAECGLLERAECASTGGAVCGDEPAVGGLCVRGCGQDAECGSGFSCTDSQCVPRPCSPSHQTWDDVLAAVANDLRQLDADDTAFARYISVANHALYDDCNGALDREWFAVSKLLNSLSSSSTVAQPIVLNVERTLARIDIRAYDWDREISLGGPTFLDAWAALAANNPFAVRFEGDDANDAIARTGEAVPVMFADSLLATAVRPELYAALVGIPDDYRVLLADLGVARLGGLAATVRAGFVEQREQLATRWPLGSRSGYLWEITALNAPDGALFDDPLLTPSGERAVIFTLPNGFQAFAFMDADNQRLIESNSFIDVNVDNFRAMAPVSLSRRHSPRVDVRDEVLDAVSNNPERYSPEVRAAVSERYPTAPELEALLEEDAETFVRRALANANVPVAASDPISTSFDEYNRDVTLEDVAGDLLVSREELLDNLGLLAPEFSVLGGGGLDRDDFALLFRSALCTLTVTNQNMPTAEFCE